MSFDRSLFALLLIAWTGLAQAFGLQAERVAPGIWALVGEIGPRTAENHLLNNTLGFLDFLADGVKQALEDWKDLGETTDELSEAPQFRHLKFYDGWHRRNINRTYLELEAAQ